MIQLHDPLTVLNAPPAVEDERGNITRNWSAASATEERGRVQPVDTSENPENVLVNRWRVTLYPTSVASSQSRIVWRGDTYEVDGEVQLQTDMYGRPHHLTGLLRRVEG